MFSCNASSGFEGSQHFDHGDARLILSSHCKSHSGQAVLCRAPILTADPCSRAVSVVWSQARSLTMAVAVKELKVVFSSFLISQGVPGTVASLQLGEVCLFNPPLDFHLLFQGIFSESAANVGSVSLWESWFLHTAGWNLTFPAEAQCIQSASVVHGSTA